MSVFRQIQTTYWEDVYVEDLKPEKKLLFLYLLTNTHTKQCGVYEISIRAISIDTGLSKEDVKKVMDQLIEAGKIQYNDANKEIYIVNWLKYNSAKSPKVASLVDKEIKDIKTPEFESEVIMRCKELGYPIKTKYKPKDTVSIEYGYGMDSLSIQERNNNNNKNNNNNHNNNQNNNAGEQATTANDSPVQKLIENYQNNFGVVNPTIFQTIEADCSDFGYELVEEAMKRAAVDNKGYRYAQGILKNWEKKNIKTLEDVKAEDVAFANRQKGGRKPVQRETLPDWAQDNNVKQPAKSSNPASPEEIQRQLAKLKARKEG
ncbi:DnaD domain protein [Pediococcus pentosaceus]|uniref:DnaD domain-containing protein n=1 Tax=Pediococcus pentosaceus TaxID=1255 RepID=UPI003F24C69B